MVIIEMYARQLRDAQKESERLHQVRRQAKIDLERAEREYGAACDAVDDARRALCEAACNIDSGRASLGDQRNIKS